MKVASHPPQRPRHARDSWKRRLAYALLALALLAAGCGPAPADDAPASARQRGRGPLLAPFDAITTCDVSRYRGPETPLYSNRPYHTQAVAEPLRGLAFCLGERHGTRVWILEVTRPTRLLALGSDVLGLGERGWTPLPDAVRVEAAGVAFDRLYARDVAPGRYVLRQGYSPAAPVIFWDESAVHPAP